jgi:phosphohistidine swiveling domain-containing protein
MVEMILPITVLVPYSGKSLRGPIVTASKFAENGILFVDTRPFESILYIPKSRCVILKKGGIVSHAAIVCREFGIPCVRCNSHFEPGTIVEIDFEKEVLKIIPKNI